MEFYARVDSDVGVLEIQEQLSIESLPTFCRFIASVAPGSHGGMEMFSDWGTHTVNRELIRQGLRFTLPDCPNALAWTITTESHGELVFHAAINRETHEPDFIETLEQFTSDWESGLARAFS